MLLSLAKKNKTQQGFTLIELSIVMIIIGLIISGVLIGQDLIHGAEVRAMITQMDKYSAAINSFKTKFNALPGDFNAASTYISSGSVNGDNNGYIYVNGSATTGTAATLQALTLSATSEFQGFWQHLSALSLIDGSYSGTPLTAITLGTNFPLMKNNKAGILAYSFADATGLSNFYHLGLAPNATGKLNTSQGGFSPDDAHTFDTKVDDGMPATGNVVAKGGTSGPEGAYTTSATVGGAFCAVTVASVDYYNTSAGSALQCQLRIKFN